MTLPRWYTHSIGGVGAAVMAVVVAWHLAWNRPTQDHRDELQFTLEDAREQIDEYELRLQEAPSIAAERRALEADWSTLTNSFVGPENADRIQDQIRSLADEHRLTVLDLRLDFDPLLDLINAEQSKSPLSTMGLTVNGRGRYADIGRFVDSLVHDVSVSEVRALEVLARDEAYPELYFSVALDMFLLSQAGGEQ